MSPDKPSSAPGENSQKSFEAAMRRILDRCLRERREAETKAQEPPVKKVIAETRRSGTDVVNRIAGFGPDRTARCLPKSITIRELFEEKEGIPDASITTFNVNGMKVYALVQFVIDEKEKKRHVSYYAVSPVDDGSVVFLYYVLLRKNDEDRRPANKIIEKEFDLSRATGSGAEE